jgi:two-component system, LytTR family, sensor kinase
VLWTSVTASLTLAALTLVVLGSTRPPSLPAGPGPVLPRMPGPGASLGVGGLLRSMGIGSLTWYASILAAPGFVLLGRRFPWDRRGWVASLAAYALVIGALVVITAVVQYRLAYGGSPMAPALGIYLRAVVLTGGLPFLAVAALTQAFDARARAHERELDAVQVRGQLAEARLAALTAQLQPHFLFNTLQGISTLIRSDPEGADRMLARLSDLLREVLLQGGGREVSMEEELRVLEAYLDIARWRFGARLSVTVDVAEVDRTALVPFFLLQPLVENALRHGVESRAGPASVRIAATRSADVLEVAVTNGGGAASGLPAGATSTDAGEDERRGVGLANTRARLTELYAEAYTLVHGADGEGGFEVRVTLPYRRAAGEATA